MVPELTLYPVVLAGGAGTRLWPLSREHHPKQFLPLLGERSPFQAALRRLAGFEGAAAPLVVCNQAHRFLASAQLGQLRLPPAALLLEPVGRNTAPAATLAALWALEAGPDALLLLMPSDHVIQDLPAFQAVVRQGLPPASRGEVVTFGVRPTAPATGYGYLRRGAEGRVAEFVEKPDRATAQRYLDSGDYLWNSGIFLLRASTWLEELSRHRPDVLAACQGAWAAGDRDPDFRRPDPELFAACPADSIDYAVMERTDRARVLPLKAGWSDLGDWSSCWQIEPKDARGNVVQGDVVAEGTENSLLLARQRLVAAVGLRDVVVVETADAVLVAHQRQAQAVKAVVEQLKRRGRAEAQVHRRVAKPWGAYEVLEVGEGFQVKRLTVAPGALLSLQRHRHRAEHWVVVQGTARVTRGREVFELEVNRSTFIPRGEVHRLENPAQTTLELIEVQVGDYLGEDDIVRLEDRYRRG